MNCEHDPRVIIVNNQELDSSLHPCFSSIAWKILQKP